MKRTLFLFITLFALQILIFNNIPILGFSTPYVYVLFIIMLPFEIPKALLLIFAFGSGLLIDFSTNSPGVHAGATLAMAFARPYILKMLSPRTGYDINTSPMLAHYSIGWFVKYSLLCVAIHHIILFFNFSFTVEDSLFLVIRAIINIMVTMLLIVLSQYFVYKK
jgi:hypothetical protein